MINERPHLEEINLKSKDNHMTNGQGGPLCGAPMLGILYIWQDEAYVTCEKCLEKMKVNHELPENS